MSAFDTNLEQQLETARILTEAPGHKILVVGIAAGGVESGRMTRSVSQGTTKAHARIFIAGLEREIARIKRLIGEPA